MVKNNEKKENTTNSQPKAKQLAKILNDKLRGIGLSVMDRVKLVNHLIFWKFMEEKEYLKSTFWKKNGWNKINEKDAEKYVKEINKIWKDLPEYYKGDNQTKLKFKEIVENYSFPKELGKIKTTLFIAIDDISKIEGDFFGKMYEEFLATIADAGNLGEFYTPRQIVEFMTFILESLGLNADSTVCDPSCGSGGFLVKLFEDVYKNERNDENIYGWEINQDSYIFALMNMFVHGDGKAKLKNVDSLDEKHYTEYFDRFDYVIANPPYGAKGLVEKDIFFEYKIKKEWEEKNRYMLDYEVESNEGKKTFQEIIVDKLSNFLIRSLKKEVNTRILEQILGQNFVDIGNRILDLYGRGKLSESEKEIRDKILEEFKQEISNFIKNKKFKYLKDLREFILSISDKLWQSIINQVYPNATNNSELLFLQLIWATLKDDGWAFVIVPEGVNFRNSNADVYTRKWLCEHSSEFFVFSLPAGAFLPYTGVKTSIYLFKKTLNSSESVGDFNKACFINIENDGYSLDKKRRQIGKIVGEKELEINGEKTKFNFEHITDKSDFWKIIEKISNTQNEKKTISILKKTFCSSKQEKIFESIYPQEKLENIVKVKQGIQKDLGNQFTKEEAQKIKGEINDLITRLKNGYTTITEEKDILKKIFSLLEDGKGKEKRIDNKIEKFISKDLKDVIFFLEEINFYPFLRIENFTQGSEDIRYVFYNGDNFVKNGDIVIVRYGSAGEIFIVEGYNKAILANNLFKIDKFLTDEISKSYFYYIWLLLVKDKLDIIGASMKELKFEKFYSISIPLPPLEIQKQIVGHLENMQILKDKSERLEKILKEEVGVESEFFDMEGGEQINWNDLLNFINGYSWKNKENISVNGEKVLIYEKNKYSYDYPIIKIATLNSDKIEEGVIIKEPEIFNEKFEKYFLSGNNDLLYGWSGNRDTSIRPFLGKYKGVLNQHIYKVYYNKNSINKKYLYYLLYSLTNLIKNKSHGGVGLTHINDKKIFEELQNLTLPPYPIQLQLAKYFHTYFLFQQIISNLENTIVNLQKNYLEGMLTDKEVAVDWILKEIENAFEEEKTVEEEINDIYENVKQCFYNSFKIVNGNTANEIVNQISENIENNLLEQIVKNIAGKFETEEKGKKKKEELEQIKQELKEVSKQEFEIIKQTLLEEIKRHFDCHNCNLNLSNIFKEKDFLNTLYSQIEQLVLNIKQKNGEVFNYELYKKIKQSNQQYFNQECELSFVVDIDAFETYWKKFNEHLYDVVQLVICELENISRGLKFTYNQSQAKTYIDQYMLFLAWITDKIGKELVFDIGQLNGINFLNTYLPNKTLEQVYEEIRQNYYFTKEQILNYYLSSLTKQFVIFWGITGIGKSKLAKEFPKALYGESEFTKYYKHIAVKSKWEDDKEIKGFYDHLEDDYREGEFISIAKKALLDRKNPYFVLLDEMNLSKIEHYLSDFLSFVETMDNRGVESLEEISLYDEFYLKILREFRNNFERFFAENYILERNRPDYINDLVLELINGVFKSKLTIRLFIDFMEENKIFGIYSLALEEDERRQLGRLLNILRILSGQSIKDYFGRGIDTNEKVEIFRDFITYLDIILTDKLIENTNLQEIIKRFIKSLFNEVELCGEVKNKIIGIMLGEEIEVNDVNEAIRVYIEDNDLNFNNTEFNFTTPIWNIKSYLFALNFVEKNINELTINLIGNNENIQTKGDFIRELIKLGFTVRAILEDNEGNIIERNLDDLCFSNEDINTFRFIISKQTQNYLSDFIYLAEYKFHYNEKSKKSKREQIEEFRHKLVSKLKEGYVLKLVSVDGQISGRNIFTLTVGDLENAKFELGIRIPDNLYITGTMNVDEAGEMISPKVIDRANIIEWDEVCMGDENANDIFGALPFLRCENQRNNQNDRNNDINLRLEDKPFCFEIIDKIYPDRIKEILCSDLIFRYHNLLVRIRNNRNIRNIVERINFPRINIGILREALRRHRQIRKFLTLNSVNRIQEFSILLSKIYHITKKANIHFGYRTINEILTYLINFEKRFNTNQETFNKLADLQLYQKILPKFRVSGSKGKEVVEEMMAELLNIDLNNEIKIEIIKGYFEKREEGVKEVLKEKMKNISVSNNNNQLTIDYNNVRNILNNFRLREISIDDIKNNSNLVKDKFNIFKKWKEINQSNLIERIIRELPNLNINSVDNKMKDDLKQAIKTYIEDELSNQINNLNLNIVSNNFTHYQKTFQKLLNMLKNYDETGMIDYWS